MSSFCLFEILYCRGHHGESFHRWGTFPSELDYLPYDCIEEGVMACGCRGILATELKILLNRVFSHPDKNRKTRLSNIHDDPNYFQPKDTKEVPSLLMLSGIQMRNQLTNMLNNKRLSRYHYAEFKNIQSELEENYGLSKSLSLWTLPSLNYPVKWEKEMRDDHVRLFLRFGDIPFSDMGFHMRLFQPDLFRDEYDVWSSFLI